MQCRRAIVATVALSIFLGGCSEHETKTVERSVSPLVGTWMRDGDTPKPDPNNPQFTKLTFAANGALTATYVAAGGALASVIGKAPKIQVENDTYATPDASTLKIAEGSRHLAYHYRISGEKLFLTATGSGEALVFTKSNAS